MIERKLGYLKELLYTRFPFLDRALRQASLRGKDIYINGLLSRMELENETLEEAYSFFLIQEQQDKSEHIGPLKAAYKHLKKTQR